MRTFDIASWHANIVGGSFTRDAARKALDIIRATSHGKPTLVFQTSKSRTPPYEIAVLRDEADARQDLVAQPLSFRSVPLSGATLYTYYFTIDAKE